LQDDSEAELKQYRHNLQEDMSQYQQNLH
jgi:hypothetical protein